MIRYPVIDTSSCRFIQALERSLSFCFRYFPSENVELRGGGNRGRNIVWKLLPARGGRRLIVIGSIAETNDDECILLNSTKINKIACAKAIRAITEMYEDRERVESSRVRTVDDGDVEGFTFRLKFRSSYRRRWWRFFHTLKSLFVLIWIWRRRCVTV